MTTQKAPDFIGADRKTDIMDRVNKSPVEHHRDNERRLQRLLSDSDLLQECIAAHPFIHIKESFGFPPEKYHLVFRIDGLLQAGKSVEPKSEHIVEILLPDDYPDAPPVCTMLSRIFHPNISGDRIDIKEQWTPETALADLVINIGRMIVFQRYSIKAPLNKEAAQWVVQNQNQLPLSAVDFNRRVDTAFSGSPAQATALAGTGRAGDLKDAGDPDPIVFEDVAAQLITDKGEPREDDTAQLSIETVVSFAASGEKNGVQEMENQPAPAMVQPVQSVALQYTASDAKVSVPARATSLDHVEPPAPAHPKPRFLEPENRGERKKTAGFDGKGIICLKCGNKNNWMANFCTRCGATLTSMAPQRITRMVIAVSAIIALVLAAEVEIIVFLVNL